MHATQWLPPCDQLLSVMQRIYQFRMTTTSGGNLSVVDDTGQIWITPARVDKGSLRRTDMVCVRPGGESIGLHPPSSELPFHQAIYAARPDLRAIVHAHPTSLVAFSMTRQTPDTRLFPQAHQVCGQPGFAPYGLPGSRQLGQNIAHAFMTATADQTLPTCVVLENHGVVVGGSTLAQAFERFEALEFAAKTIIQARQLGTMHHLTATQLAESAARRSDFCPANFPPPGAEELELRRELCEFTRRGVRQRLLISTEGSFSARLDEERFVITPSQRDRYELQPADLVLVRGNTAAAGQYPSRASRLHQSIYRQHAEVRAIVLAHPVHATAYSVTHEALDARTIPESYIFLRDVRRIAYGPHFGAGTAVAEVVGPQQPAAIIDNDGVLVLGKSVLDAFDRLEVLETTAEALIHSRALGPVTVMGDTVIEELRRVFLGG
ncbi:MAG: class II aldolase/adducin family protein [Pirellulales bacterium]|nr:class II aldolase/adducin family protein [Pirellulales bacterium]